MNEVWTDLCKWIDQHVEDLPEKEEKVCGAIVDAGRFVSEIVEEKCHLQSTVSVNLIQDKAKHCCSEQAHK